MQRFEAFVLSQWGTPKFKAQVKWSHSLRGGRICWGRSPELELVDICVILGLWQEGGGPSSAPGDLSYHKRRKFFLLLSYVLLPYPSLCVIGSFLLPPAARLQCIRLIYTYHILPLLSPPVSRRGMLPPSPYKAVVTPSEFLLTFIKSFQSSQLLESCKTTLFWAVKMFYLYCKSRNSLG